MSDIVERLRATALDKDNFPRMDSERWFPVGLAKEAAAEIERLKAAIREAYEMCDPRETRSFHIGLVLRRALEGK